MKNEAAEANAKLAAIRSQTHNGKMYERSDVEYMLALAVTAGGGLGAVAPQWFRDQAKLIAGTLDQLAAVTDTENFQRGLAIKAIGRIGELEQQLADKERECGELKEQGGPLDSERCTLDELLEVLSRWKAVASGGTCVSFQNLCYGASSLWHQTHRENFRKVDRKPEALSRWVLEHAGSVHDDFPAQVLSILVSLKARLAERGESVGELVLEGLRRELWLALDHYHVIERRGHSVFIKENGRHGESPWRELLTAIEVVSLPPNIAPAAEGGEGES